MIPLASITAKVLGKRMGKVSTQAQERSGDLNRYLIDLFKNHKIIKIFQREDFEKSRSEIFVNNLKEKSAKIAAVYIRSAPVMEVLTGIMIAILIFYSGKLIMSDELNINNFQNNNYKNINNNKKEDLDCINNLNKILLLSLCF